LKFTTDAGSARTTPDLAPEGAWLPILLSNAEMKLNQYWYVLVRIIEPPSSKLIEAAPWESQPPESLNKDEFTQIMSRMLVDAHILTNSEPTTPKELKMTTNINAAAEEILDRSKNISE